MNTIGCLSMGNGVSTSAPIPVDCRVQRQRNEGEVKGGALEWDEYGMK